MTNPISIDGDKKTYLIRVNCVSFKDFKVIAKNKKDAIDEAERYFQCDSTEGEFGEFLEDTQDNFSGEELEVYYD